MLLRKIKIWDHGSLNDFIPKKKCQNGIAENLNVNGIKDNQSKQSHLLNCSMEYILSGTCPSNWLLFRKLAFMRKFKVETYRGKDSKASNQQRMLNPQDDNSTASTTKLGFQMLGCYCSAAAPLLFLLFPLSLPCTHRHLTEPSILIVADPCLA